MEAVKIPRRIDEPPNLLLWTLDEFIPPIVGLLFGLMVNHALPCMFLGFIATSFYRRYRDGHPDGYFVHMAYYYLGFPLKGRSFVNPFIKEFLP